MKTNPYEEHNRRAIEHLIRELERTRGASFALMEACRFGLLDEVLRLLDPGGGVNARDERDITPLMMAASGGQVNVVSCLLERGADVNAVGPRGWTPLISFAAAWHKEKDAYKVAKLLIEAGAGQSARSEEGKTAADYLQGKYTNKVSALLSGTHPNTRKHEAVGSEVRASLGIPELRIKQGSDRCFALFGKVEIPLPTTERLKTQAIDVCRLTGDSEAALALSACDLSYDVAEGEGEQVIEVVIAAPDDVFAMLHDHSSPVTQAIMGALLEVCPDLASERLVRKQ
jgi:hypothetical protein